MKTKTYKLGKGVVFRDYKDFGLVVNVPLRKNIIINSSASKILKLIQGGVQIDTLINSIKTKGLIVLNKKELLQILSKFVKMKIVETI